MPKVKYVNSQNREIVFNGDGKSFMDCNPLRSFAWAYSSDKSNFGIGGTIRNFDRQVTSKTISVTTKCDSQAELFDYQNNLHAITETDVYAETPGKLYVNDQYMVCYITAATVADYNITSHLAKVTLTIVSERPYWCTERLYQFNKADTAVDTTGKKYNLKYPYRFGTGITMQKLKNTHFASCPAIITIFGPCSNPSFTLGGIVRNVQTEITASEKIIINQVDHTIVVENAYGERSNVFNYRNKNFDIFAEIPPGESNVVYSGEFLITITLIMQRSQPEWQT